MRGKKHFSQLKNRVGELIALINKQNRKQCLANQTQQFLKVIVSYT